MSVLRSASVPGSSVKRVVYVSSLALVVIDLTNPQCSARAPTADLPTTAAFLGGMVAQEAIKMITKQYVPVNGYCVIDMVDSWTGVVG